MARSHRTTPSAQTSVPGRVGRVRSGTQEAAPVPAATQLATTTSMRSTRAKSVESNASIGSRASRTRRGTDAPKEIQAIGESDVNKPMLDREHQADAHEHAQLSPQHSG